VVWFLLIAISIIDLLPVMMADPEALYVLHGVDISDLCDASNVPYSVLVDFDLPFHGELVHVNKMSLKVSVNDNPNQKRGHVDKNLLVSSDFQPLFKKSDGSSSNVLGGGESSLDFSDAAKLHDLAAAGKLATDQMNMYDLQVIVDLNVPIFTGRFMIPIWYARASERASERRERRAKASARTRARQTAWQMLLLASLAASQSERTDAGSADGLADAFAFARFARGTWARQTAGRCLCVCSLARPRTWCSMLSLDAP
jgi:hypothetical protein